MRSDQCETAGLSWLPQPFELKANGYRLWQEREKKAAPETEGYKQTLHNLQVELVKLQRHVIQERSADPDPARSPGHFGQVRARICEGLGFLGVHLEEIRNATGKPVISADHGHVQVRVIRTDEDVITQRRFSECSPAPNPACTPNSRSGPMNNPLSSDLIQKMDAYWRATNYLLVGQIYLYDNPLLKIPLRLEHVKPRLRPSWL